MSSWTRVLSAVGALADAVTALHAYAALAHHVGDMRRAVQNTLAMIERDPAFAAQPAIREKRAKLEAEWQHFSRTYGVTSEAAWDATLSGGHALATTVLARHDVTDDARQLAWLARAHLAFAQGQYDIALADITQVLDRAPDRGRKVSRCISFPDK